MEEEITSMMLPMERTSSIEKEPRTLSIGRLQFAREAAEYVINTRSVEEALIIFTKGLVPVTTCHNNNDQDKTSMEFDKEEEEGGEEGEEPKYCRNLLRIAEPRDIASAPF